MRRLANNSDGIAEAVQVLKAGGVIAHPADTCYGLAADFKNPEALKKIQAIKGRDGQKPMSIMLPSYMKPEIEKYAVLDDFSRTVCKRLFPGPVTILLPKGPEIPPEYYPETPNIGIRIPYDAGTQDILLGFKGPLITTSANLSGTSACSTSDEVIKSLMKSPEKPDLILEGAITKECKPSTVILVKDGKISIEREGPMSKSEIENILGTDI